MSKTPTQIKSLARAHTETAVNVLAGIMNQPDSPAAARVAAAQAILDRGWGKPHQTADIIHHSAKASELSDDELAGIVTGGSGEGTAETSRGPSQLN